MQKHVDPSESKLSRERRLLLDVGPHRLGDLAASRLALDARDRREGRRDRHRLEEASRQRQMTCQRFKTDSCFCNGPAKLRGGTDALLLLRRRSPLPARLDGSPLLSVNPPSPDRGQTRIVNVTHDS